MDRSSAWEVLGASVRGPAHRRAGLPNQDAWLTRHTPNGTVAVACDGLGSAPRSHIGAGAACEAVVEAVQRWASVPDAPFGLLTRLIHVFWALRIVGEEIRDCATTCLFAASLQDRRLLLGQLGDGLVMARIPGRPTRILVPEREGFATETTGLGVARSLDEWTVRIEREVDPGAAVLLATDGVADDLDPDSREAFVDHLLEHHGAMGCDERARALEQELEAWPTPKHLDDKTIVLLWSNTVEAKETM